MARRKSGRPAYVLQDISAPNIIKDLLLLCGATIVMLTIISVLLLTNVADLLATWELSKSRIAFRPEAHCKRALLHMFCGLLLFEAVLLYIILLLPLRTDNKTAMGFLDCFGGKVAKSCARKGKKERQKEKGESVLKIASQAMRGEDGLMEVVSKLKVYKWTMGWFSGSGALPKVENVTEENKKKKTKGKKNRRKGEGQTSEARGGAVPVSKDHNESGSPGGEETPGHSHGDKDFVKEPASPLKSSSSGTWSTDSQDNGGFTTVTYKGARGKTKKSSPLPNDGLHPGSHAVSEVKTHSRLTRSKAPMSRTVPPVPRPTSWLGVAQMGLVNMGNSLVGRRLSLQDARDHFAQDDGIVANLVCLEVGAARVKFWRKVAGDGNCGYRTVMVGMVGAAHRNEKLRAHLMMTLPVLISAMTSWTFANEAIPEYHYNLERGYALLMALINNGDDKPVENLLNDFRQQHESDQMLLFMRAVAAYGFLQSPEQSLEILRSLLCADNFDCRDWTLEKILVRLVLRLAGNCSGLDYQFSWFDDASACALAKVLGIAIETWDVSHIRSKPHAIRRPETASQVVVRLVTYSGHYDLVYS